MEIITHLQFADNIVLFSLATTEEVLTLKRFLRCFQLASKLMLNLSRALSWVLVAQRRWFSLWQGSIHCKGGKLPIMYLGKAEVDDLMEFGDREI